MFERWNVFFMPFEIALWCVFGHDDVELFRCQAELAFVQDPAI